MKKKEKDMGNSTTIAVFSAMVCVVILVLIVNAKPVESNATDNNISDQNQNIGGDYQKLPTEKLLLNKGVLLSPKGNLFKVNIDLLDGKPSDV